MQIHVYSGICTNSIAPTSLWLSGSLIKGKERDLLVVDLVIEKERKLDDFEQLTV
jgi:hypothetical protein